VNIRNEYNSQLFLGVSLFLNNDQDLIHLANANSVIGISPVTLIPRPVPQKSVVLSGPDDPALATGEGDAQSVHIMTGVNKLHAQGITGRGIRVGIIDSGINYPHPSLGGCFGPGCKVAYGFDFVGDAYNGTNTPAPDSDPNDTCNGHGTHVAGIVGE
jgi:subtilisin family serine protease